MKKLLLAAGIVFAFWHFSKNRDTEADDQDTDDVMPKVPPKIKENPVVNFPDATVISPKGTITPIATTPSPKSTTTPAPVTTMPPKTATAPAPSPTTPPKGPKSLPDVVLA